MSHFKYIDCRILGYGNDSGGRVIATYNLQNDTFTISQMKPFRPSAEIKKLSPEQVEKRKQMQRNTVIVTNTPDAFDNWDMCFKEIEHIHDAVLSYFMMKNTNTLILENEIKQRHNPDGNIEKRKLDMGGSVYELNDEDINSGTMCVLVACWAAQRMKNMVSLTEAPVELSEDDEDDLMVPTMIY